jgi:hypothetical protein
MFVAVAANPANSKHQIVPPVTNRIPNNKNGNAPKPVVELIN